MASVSRPFIYTCFFLSGFSGLVNEVVWSRLFVYTMGSSHLSIAVVVSVFMGGLALGSAVGGPLADRVASPLRLYGWLVLAAGTLAGAVFPLLRVLEPLLGHAYRLHDGQPGHPFFTAAKAVVCAATIFLPTSFMGATLPALVKHMTRREGEVGSRVGALYAVNTFGAVVGVCGAGFFLIGRLGLGFSAALGALVDVAVGLAVLFLTRAARLEPAGAAASPPAPAPLERRVPAAVQVAVAAFGVSGFVNMCLQLGWTRSIILSIGNSTYGFSVIVGIFILGLALGGWIAGLFADRLKSPLSAFGWLLVATSAAAGLTIPWLGTSPARFAWQLGTLTRKGGFDFGQFLLAGAGSVALVMLPATVLMGMAFPLVGRLRAAAGSGVGRAVGAAYASNTVGAILGTALTGFLLVPLLGSIWKLLYLAVALGFLAGAVVLLVAPPPRRAARLSVLGGVTAALLAAAFLTRPHGVLESPGSPRAEWHPVILSLGAYRNFPVARSHPSPESYAREMIRLWDPLYYRDGEAASVAVIKERKSGRLCLNISGKTDASAGDLFSFDLQTQLLMGHLPLLVHPAPRRVLNLGLGGGMSLGAMTVHPEVESIDLLELSPEVEEAARLFFSDANRGALGNPRVRKVIGDGRNHLTHTSRTYDVISSEPSNFWIAGLGNLFTEEFYRLVKGRLNPGGLVCQWIYGYNLRLADYKVALRTIQRVFPQVTVWTNSYGDTILLASVEPMTFREDRISLALAVPAIGSDLASIGIAAPEDLFRYFQADGEALRSWIEEGPTNRDLFPVLEYSSPLGFFDSTSPDVYLSLMEACSRAEPRGLLEGFSPSAEETIRARIVSGRTLNRFFRAGISGDWKGALEEYRRLAREGDPWSLDCASRALVKDAALLKSRGILREAREVHDTAELCMADDSQPLKGRDFSAALEEYRAAALRAPAGSWEAYLALALVEIRGSLFQDAEKSLAVAEARRAPPFTLAHARGIARGMQGDLAGAERSLREALDRIPPGSEKDRAEITYNLGFCLEERGKLPEAAAAFRKAMDLGDDPVRAGIARARCLRKHGDLAGAVESATHALAAAHRVGKESGEARAEVARARAATGNMDEAILRLEEAVQVAPGHYERELEDLRRRAGR